ncbi:MAG: hypothetical protein CBD72_01145 [Flavobacteriaceae bacterium TMED212]|mgnify:CR=1 FL=1|nr:MAG: hypothetical protein CBD72_01145 [Flavobacteriaceae bacterium TMED212]
MKTGYFNQIDNDLTMGYVSISLYPSKNKNVLYEFKSLVPNWKLLEMHKSKQLSDNHFEKEYLIQLNSLDANTIFEQINFLTGDYEPILMTHGNKTSFCHRHILAKWFEEKLEVEIEEFKTGLVTRSKGYMKKITQKRLFENE